MGVGFPGIIREGVVEESPNLQQIKGFHLREALETAFASSGAHVPVRIYNDADATAAGIAATRGVMEQTQSGVDAWQWGWIRDGFRGVRAPGKAATRW